jgi:hypothetical protein
MRKKKLNKWQSILILCVISFECWAVDVIEAKICFIHAKYDVKQDWTLRKKCENLIKNDVITWFWGGWGIVYSCKCQLEKWTVHQGEFEVDSALSKPDMTYFHPQTMWYLFYYTEQKKTIVLVSMHLNSVTSQELLCQHWPETWKSILSWPTGKVPTWKSSIYF